MNDKMEKSENVEELIHSQQGSVEAMQEIESKDDTAEKKQSGIENAFEWIDPIVESIVLVMLLFTFVFGKVEVSGNSMLDTLHNGDQLIITGYNYAPVVGDIVIISRNSSNTEEGKKYSDKPLVKRIVAIGGQTVEIKNGYLYVDGERQNEEYAKTLTANNGFIGKKTVPKDCVFVLGDNRDDSADSRLIGFIDQNYILGKVLCRILPLNNITVF